MNKSYYDVIKAEQRKKDRVSYYLNDMDAASNIGLTRKTQEDSVLLLEHFKNNDFKLLTVADGMGGLVYGEKASNLAVLKILKWFLNLPPDYYYKENRIILELYDKLNEIDSTIRDLYKNAGTTLSLAIVCKNNTVVVSVGDSRVYVHQVSDLIQITKDHSKSFELYLEGVIKDKDDVRFHKKNHLLTSRLGGAVKKLIIDDIVLKNMDYETLILLTDGVTDCVSDEKIKSIIESNNDNVSLSNKLVVNSLYYRLKKPNLDPKEYYDEVAGGKDNSTAACYVRVKK